MVECETRCFKGLVERELRCAKRYRRFFSIVVGLPLDNSSDPLRVLTRSLRETDEVVPSESGLTILMVETDPTGAWMAIQRLRARFGGAIGMRFGVASYPKDGRDVDALLGVARGRLDDA
jgi:hypothetical protein